VVEFDPKLRRDITPIMFPCGQCETVKFHQVWEQPTGLAIALPFTRKALASTGRGYMLVCGECTTISARLHGGDVAQLASNFIPRTMYTAYPALQEIYTPGFLAKIKGKVSSKGEEPGADDPKVEAWIKNYRLEI